MPYLFATWQPPTGAMQAAADGYRLWLAPIDTPSDDGRVIVQSLGARAGRLPIMFSDSEIGHGDAVHVGTFTDVRIVDADGVRWAVSDTVEWDTDATAVEARRLVDAGQMRGVSIHMGRGRFADVCPTAGGYTETEPELVTDDDGMPIDVSYGCDQPLLGAFDAEIAAVTIVAIPAFPAARLEPTTVVAADAGIDITDPAEVEVSGNVVKRFDHYVQAPPAEIVADALAVLDDVMQASLDAPPADWFADPQFGANAEADDRLVFDSTHNQYGCPLTVTPDGRVFGHLALWRTCHTGYRGSCVTVPRGADTDSFYQCRVQTDDGQTLAVGPLVVDEGHAPVAWSTDRVSRHYADTTLAAAYVRVGEDEHGIWVAGALSPRATPAMIETLRRHSLSGDWRRNQISGRYELIAAVSVNSPGFPVPQALTASSGELVGLISYGAPQSNQPSDLELVHMAIAALAERFGRFERLLTDGEVVVETTTETVEAVEECDECTPADEVAQVADVLPTLAAEYAGMLDE